MKVLIVGGGMGGMCLAAFLEAEGVDYMLVDKTDDWKKQGFEVSVWKNGRDILKKLGLAEQFDRNGEKIRYECFRDGEGRPIRKIPFLSLFTNYGTAATIIPRLTLHEMLLGKVAQDKIHKGITVTRLEESDAKIVVDMSDGSRESFDLVVGADGVRSVVRSLLYGPDALSFIDYRVWYFWTSQKIHKPNEISTYIANDQVATVFGSQHGAMAFLFLPHTHGDVDAVEGRIERLKKSFADLSAITPSLFEGVKDEDIIVGDLADIHCNMWYTKHSVLIGDAAHCLGPHAGMGSSLAFEDAYVLAGELLRVEEGKTTLGRALRRYERKQSFRVSLVKHLTMKVRLGTTQRNPLLRRLILWGLRVVPLTVLFTDLNRLFRREM